MQVANTGKPITDDEIRDRLLGALPLDSGPWQQNRMWAIQQKADLEATISLLEQNDATPSGDADGSAPIVSYANNKEKTGPDGFTDRQQKQFESLLEVKRKFGKRRRGDQDYGDQSHDQSRVRKDYSKDKLGVNQCAFCRKEGHYQADCSVYKRLQS
jgi:hypothetical protein